MLCLTVPCLLTPSDCSQRLTNTLFPLYFCFPFSSFPWKYLGQQRHYVADRPPLALRISLLSFIKASTCCFFISFHLPYFFLSAPENSCFLQFIWFVALLLPFMHPMQHPGLLLLAEHQHCSSVRCHSVVSQAGETRPLSL